MWTIVYLVIFNVCECERLCAPAWIFTHWTKDILASSYNEKA